MLSNIKTIYNKCKNAFYSKIDKSVEHIEADQLNNAAKNNNILENAKLFNELTADDIMVPRADIVAVPLDIKTTELRKTFASTGHTRLPVFKSNIDEIIGFVHVKDFFKKTAGKKPFSVNDIIRNLILVPSTIKIKDLLTRMKSSRLHMAVVLDEYGGTEGLVTTEDIIEVIFGEITDEHDKSLATMIRYKDNAAIVNGKIEIEDLESQLQIKLRDDENDDEYDTLAGYIITKMGKIPTTGEKYKNDENILFTIEDSSDRRVLEVKIDLSKKRVKVKK